MNFITLTLKHAWLIGICSEKKKSSESYYHSFPEGKMAIRPRKDIQFTIKDG